VGSIRALIERGFVWNDDMGERKNQNMSLVKKKGELVKGGIGKIDIKLEDG